MIVTVTPNPSIDRTLRIPPLTRGQLVRATSTTSEAGGKGVNVSRTLAAHGERTVAIVPMSPSSFAIFRSLLAGSTQIESVPIAGDVRVNVSLVEEDGTVTKVNEPGPRLDTSETTALIERTAELARGATWVVGSGSLPPDAPVDLYVRLAETLPSSVPLAVDTDGPALRACLGRPIALLKPNHRELATLMGDPLPTIGDVIGAATEIVRGGVGGVLVSLGGDGAVFVDADGATHAEARIDDVRNTVGAGDALLAGFLAGARRPDRLRLAVGWSIAACRSPGTQARPVTNADLEAVTIHRRVSTARRLAA